MSYLTDETFTYIINGNDVDKSFITIDGEWTDFGKTWGINMGSHLNPNVERYYCEIIQYVFAFGKTAHYGYDAFFDSVISDIPEDGYLPEVLKQSLTQDFKPLTSFERYRSWEDNLRQPGTMHNQMIDHKTTFVCKNFNSTMKHFQVVEFGETLGLAPEGKYSSNLESSYTYKYGHSWKAYLNNVYRINIKDNRYPAVYPLIIMNMTPIYKDKIPRLLKTDDAITLNVSSFERKTGVYGMDCTIPIPQIPGNHTRFKAVVEKLSFNLHTQGEEWGDHRNSFALRFVCYDWNQSQFGYGGDKFDSSVFVLSSIIPATKKEKMQISPKNGSVIEIKNIAQDIRFAIVGVNMNNLSTSSNDNNLPHGILSASNPVCEWTLTLKLYPIN
jgi:hypothetical protein